MPRMRKAPWFIHCLIRAEGILDDLATPAENLRSRLQSLCHAIERVLVFEARDGANILRAARVQRAGAASLGMAVIDFFQFAQFAFADRRQRLAGRTNVDVLFRVVAELVLAEKAARNDAPHIRCASFSAPRSFPLDSRPANRPSRAPRRRPRRAVSDNPPASCRPPLQGPGNNEYAMIDATIVRAHQHSAGARKKGVATRPSAARTG